MTWNDPWKKMKNWFKFEKVVPAEKQSRGPAGKGGLKARCSDFFPDSPLLLNWWFLLFSLPYSFSRPLLFFSFRFLCLKNTNMAHVVFFRYTSQHPEFAKLSPPFDKPLLNFVWFLLLVIERWVFTSVFESKSKLWWKVIKTNYLWLII